MMWCILPHCETEIYSLISQKITQLVALLLNLNIILFMWYTSNNSHFTNVGTEKLKYLTPSQAMTTHFPKHNFSVSPLCPALILDYQVWLCHASWLLLCSPSNSHLWPECLRAGILEFNFRFLILNSLIPKPPSLSCMSHDSLYSYHIWFLLILFPFAWGSSEATSVGMKNTEAMCQGWWRTGEAFSGRSLCNRLALTTFARPS